MTNTEMDINPTVVSVPDGIAAVSVTWESPRFWVPSLRVSTFDFTVQLVPRDRTEGTREWGKRTRAYELAATFGPEGWEEREDELVTDAVRREVSGELKGRCPVLAAHQRIGKREGIAGLRAALPVIAAALRAMGYRVGFFDGSVDARFSAKAGCGMCPCSPGFVLTERLVVNGVPVDLSFSRA
jgi:hypothetical protein